MSEKSGDRACQGDRLLSGRSWCPAPAGRGGGCGLGGPDGGGECGDVVAAVVPAAVDEEGGGAGYAAEVGGVDILGDPCGAGAFSDVVAESRAVESEVSGLSCTSR